MQTKKTVKFYGIGHRNQIRSLVKQDPWSIRSKGNKLLLRLIYIKVLKQYQLQQTNICPNIRKGNKLAKLSPITFCSGYAFKSSKKG
jgi:hypothetical protein